MTITSNKELGVINNSKFKIQKLRELNRINDPKLVIALAERLLEEYETEFSVPQESNPKISRLLPLCARGCANGNALGKHSALRPSQ